jgi:hypothetical protein
VEAAVIGLPVVYYRESLLGSLVQTVGAVADDEEGRPLIARLLAGDEELVERITSGQAAIAARFSERWCEAVWAEQLDRSGIGAAIEAASRGRDLTGFDVVDPTRFVPREELVVPGEPVDATPLRDGIDLSRINLSTALAGTHGLGEPEAWGRWVHGRTAVFLLAEPLTGDVEIQLIGGVTEENRGRPLQVQLGDATGELRLDTWIDAPTTTRTVLRVPSPASVLQITAPIVFRADGGRDLSIGITQILLRPRPSVAARVLRRARERLLRGLRSSRRPPRS